MRVILTYLVTCGSDITECTQKGLERFWRSIGILVADYIVESLSVNILSKDFEDILCISLVHTATAETFRVCVVYLPPSNSSRGDKSLEFVNVMRMLVLKLHSFDNFMICGDFNARCMATVLVFFSVLHYDNSFI